MHSSFVSENSLILFEAYFPRQKRLKHKKILSKDISIDSFVVIILCFIHWSTDQTVWNGRIVDAFFLNSLFDADNYMWLLVYKS